MWARKIGAPELWPSYVKVTIMAILVSLVILNFVMYLWGMDVTYLALHDPVSQGVNCRLPPEICRAQTNPLECALDLELVTRQVLSLPLLGLNVTKVLPDACPAALPKDQTCSTVRLPITSLVGALSKLYTVNRETNPLDLWSVIFMFVMACFGFSILIHDCALLRPSQRSKILSLEAAKKSLPCFWRWIKMMHCRQSMAQLRHEKRNTWYTCLVPWILWQCFLLISFAYPLFLICAIFIAGPCRMSRLLAFLSGALCIVWSVMFIGYTAWWRRDAYAVLWNAEASLGHPCVCLCEYPLQSEVLYRMISLAIIMAVGSLSVVLRALKGLRRANWANLFSVLYPVPINVFPVLWTQPSGDPIRWRREGEPVQGEPAFDPFALMDEQDDSTFTKVSLAPVPHTAADSAFWKNPLEEGHGDIGCCGFPYIEPVLLPNGSDRNGFKQDLEAAVLCCGAGSPSGRQGGGDGGGGGGGDCGEVSEESNPPSNSSAAMPSELDARLHSGQVALASSAERGTAGEGPGIAPARPSSLASTLAGDGNRHTFYSNGRASSCPTSLAARKGSWNSQSSSVEAPRSAVASLRTRIRQGKGQGPFPDTDEVVCSGMYHTTSAAQSAKRMDPFDRFWSAVGAMLCASPPHDASQASQEKKEETPPSFLRVD